MSFFNFFLMIILLTGLISGCGFEVPKKIQPSIEVVDGQPFDVNAKPLSLDNSSLMGVYQQNLLILNGDNLVQIDSHLGIKTFSESLKRNENELNDKNYIYVNTSSGTLEAITAKNEHVLIAGKPKTLADSIEEEVDRKPLQNKTVELNDATFNLPITVNLVSSNQWVVLDQSGKQLKLIANHQVSVLPIESDISFKGMSANQDGFLWLFNDTSIFKYDLAQHKIVKRWVDQFNRISGISVSALGFFVVDQAKSTIFKLNDDGKFEKFYQTFCNAEYEENNHGCNPILTHYDDTLRFQPITILADPNQNKLFVSTFNSIYTLNLKGQLKYLLGKKTLNVDKTDQEISKQFQECHTLSATDDGIYCNNINGLIFYKDGVMPKQVFNNKIVGKFVVDGQFIYSMHFQSIIKEPLASKPIQDMNSWWENHQWFDLNTLDFGYNNITNLTLDTQKNIFVANSDTYKVIKVHPNKEIETLVDFSTEGDLSKTQIEDNCECSLTNKQPKQIIFQENSVYMLDQVNNVYNIDLKSKVVKPLYVADKNSPSFASFIMDQQNNLWFVSNDHQIYTFQHRQLINMSDQLIELGLPKNTDINDVIFDKNGDLYMATTVNLLKLKRSTLMSRLPNSSAQQK